MGAVFSVLAAAMVITGLVSLFRPIARFRLTTRGRSLIVVAVGLALLMVAGRPPQRPGQHAFGPGSHPQQQASQVQPQPQPAPPPPQAPPMPAAQPAPQPAGTPVIHTDNGPPQWHDIPLLPANLGAPQLRFLAAVEDARASSTVTADPTALTGLRSQRLTALCQVLSEPAVANWIGRVKSMSADPDGRGRLTVEIGNHVVLTTDAGADTVIARQSPLYAEVSRFSSGDMVSVSGQFVPDQGACLREVGDLRATFGEPAFLFKFTGISRY